MPVVDAQMGMLVKVIASKQINIRGKGVNQSEIATGLYENLFAFIRIVNGAQYGASPEIVVQYAVGNIRNKLDAFFIGEGFFNAIPQ